MAFTRLVRFVGEDGQEHLGEAGLWSESESLLGKEVTILEGDVFSKLTASSKKATINKVRNYQRTARGSVTSTLRRSTQIRANLVPASLSHSKDTSDCLHRYQLSEACRRVQGVWSRVAGRQPQNNTRQIKVPPYPVVFMKPADALAGPSESIPIPAHARSRLDYEGELCVVIRQDCKDVSEADAMDQVLGFAVGNDVSAREWQAPEKSGGQFSYAKSFDKFAPVGPCIASLKAVPDPHKLQLQTRVNGKERQKSGTDDLIWSIQKIIAHASAGTTLRKGTVIMTGTPSGVAAFMQSEDAFLKSGDVVDIQISGIGTLSNKMVWK